MSHPKSIWKSTTKYHVPTAPAVMKPKPFVVWTKGKYGDEAECRSCHRTFFALHRSQKHLVSSIDGRCYYCRDLKDNTTRPRTVAEKERRGTPNFPELPMTRDLWSRGGRGALHSRKDVRRFKQDDQAGGTLSTSIHLGKIIDSPADIDAMFSSIECTTALRQKVQFPLWSCCYQHRNTIHCSKAQARSQLTDKIRNELENTEMSMVCL